MAEKQRIDVLLVKKGLFDSREQAKRAVMAGLVYIGHQLVDKPGYKASIDDNIIIKGERQKYVSRGGYKLEKALQEFHLDVRGAVALDIGASTGGFTDCLLQHGARKVYAVDVGYNQLAWKLRQDERVIVKERYNFRHAKPEDFQAESPTFAVIDVSFISLKLILPPLTKIIDKNSEVVALIKPQFEAGKADVGKKGIVRDANIHNRVLEEIIEFSKDIGFAVSGLTYSPITGGDGNIEFLIWLSWKSKKTPILPSPTTVVKQAHQQLRRDKQMR